MHPGSTLPLPAARGFVELVGIPSQPELVLRVNTYMSLPNSATTYQAWVRELPGRIWDADRNAWVINGFGAETPDPAALLAEAGLEVRYPTTGPLTGWSLTALTSPVAQFTDGRPDLLRIRPRLVGWAACRDMLGWGAVWRKAEGWFELPVMDATLNGTLRPGVIWPEGTLEASLATKTPNALPKDIQEFAARLSLAVSGDEFGGMGQLSEWTAKLPDWFGHGDPDRDPIKPFEYQLLGALGGALGHNLLADSPGVGKCVSPDTEIVANNTIRTISELWGERAHRAVPDADGFGEVIPLSKGEVVVPTVDERNRSSAESASFLYRQAYSGVMLTVRTSAGREITCSPAHQLLTPGGWTRADSLAPGAQAGLTLDLPRQTANVETMRARASDGISWTTVTEVDSEEYSGYIYDLTVPGTHNYVAEGLWTHNTLTSLAIASIRGAERTLILCPPLVATNWVRETRRAGLADHSGAVDGEIALIVPGRKVPVFPDRGVIVVPDSTAAKRDELRGQLADWRADMLIYDEAHRAMTIGSKRSEAALELGRSVAYALPVTGTPILASPHQLVPLLELSGTLGPVFGGRGPFLEQYCRRDSYGRFSPRKQHLDELGERLSAHVWVRRAKHMVLPWLPSKFRKELPVRVKLTEYKEAHAEVTSKIDSWIDRIREETGELPTTEDRETFAEASLSLISQLRQAAGVCKIPAAVEWIGLHDFDIQPDGRIGRPLCVWTHHQVVTDAMVAAVPEEAGRVGVIRGGIANAVRDELVDSFQDGQIAVLVCSITAAGVGITLTRGQDALFVETDWTPALIEQAEDRQHRIGQESNVEITTLVADGTLDEHIQGSLHKKGLVLGAVYQQDSDVSVSGYRAEDLSTAHDILEELVDERIIAAGKARKRAAA